MTEAVEITGKNVDAAIAAAEQRLGSSRDDLEIQVLSHGSRGVFGLGGEPARILVRRRGVVVEPPPAAPPAPAVTPRPSPPPSEPPSAQSIRPRETAPSTSSARQPAVLEREAPARAPVAAVTEAPIEAGVDEVAATARDILDEMLDKMGFRVDVMVRSTADPIILDVEGENLGVLIGRRGDSLSALQFMLNLMLSKRFRHWPHVVIDIQGYRARREQSLRSLALRVAQRVRRNRRAFTLEAMPANDRRIIHLTLRERSDVETYSIGEGAARRVVVAPRR